MSTTESVESVQSLEVEVVALDAVLASLKTFAVADLFKVSKASLAEAEKRVKSGKTEPKVEKEKKDTPKQLRKPTQWVVFTLKHALANGWEAFTVENKKKQEIIEMPASVQNEAGEHVYPGGKKMILTHAMSLSKQRWAPKAKEGSRKDLYDEFEAEFDAQPAEEVVAAPEKPKMVRKTAADKAAEKVANDKAKAEAKAAVAAEKAAAKEAKKAATPAKAVKAAAPAKAATPAKAVKAPAKVEGPIGDLLKPAAPVGVKPKKAAPKAVQEWTCPADGNVYPWTYKSKKFLRNSENQVWEAEADGGCGDWAGVFIPAEDRIDESAADPFADEEDEE
jgi:exonuclease VII small subunit